MQASEPVRNNDSVGAIDGRLVRHIDTLSWIEKEGAKWACAFGSNEHAEKLALYITELKPGANQVVAMGQRETVLYVMAGSGTVSIAEHPFPVSSGDGIYVRPNERFQLSASGNGPLRILMAVCPAGDMAPWESGPVDSAGFDQEFPTRVVSAGAAKSEATGDRSFKVLVGPKIGSAAVTQFIGSIPQSRAPEHFHRYEEVICVLSGQGRIWMGEHCAEVKPGSLIFLPRKQPHCMECTEPEGMNLLGMFYPAGSPAVNYETQNKE